jgi:hypothetical protein
MGGDGPPDPLARDGRLGRVGRATLPAGTDASELPVLVRDGLQDDGRFELKVESPAAALAALCSWAVEQDLELVDLDVRAPSLEESYLALTEVPA